MSNFSCNNIRHENKQGWLIFFDKMVPLQWSLWDKHMTFLWFLLIDVSLMLVESSASNCLYTWCQIKTCVVNKISLMMPCILAVNWIFFKIWGLFLYKGNVWPSERPPDLLNNQLKLIWLSCIIQESCNQTRNGYLTFRFALQIYFVVV